MGKTNLIIFALTVTGADLARQLRDQAAAVGTVMTVCLPAKFARPDESAYATGAFQPTLAQAFAQYDGLVCIMATGIVVRSLAPLIRDKTSDPAVLVMDERGHHVISLLAGHVGGANALTNWVGQLLTADPVITTATDTEHVQALDVLAKQCHGWYPEFKRTTKWINARLAAGEPVSLYVEPAFRPWLTDLRGFTVVDTLAAADPDVPLVVVSDRVQTAKRDQLVPVIPRLNVLGIGCRKNVTTAMVQAAVSEFCQEHQLAWRSIGQIASIDKKAHEAAIHYLAATWQVPVHFYTAATLRESSEKYPQSAFVQQTVGVGNVACAAADYASGQAVVTPRYAGHQITLALGRQTKDD